MPTIVTQALITALTSILIGTDAFTRIEGVVKRWEDNALNGAAKKAGVIGEIEIIGIKLAAWEVNLAIELAVASLGLGGNKAA
jgi:hypothetical protein